jgi:hypothetical protein
MLVSFPHSLQECFGFSGKGLVEKLSSNLRISLGIFVIPA